MATYFPEEIFNKVLAYCGPTIQEKQKKIWDSIRVKWDECYNVTSVMDGGDIEGISLGSSRAYCFLYDKAEDFVWCFNPVCYEGRFNPYTYSVQTDEEEPTYQYPVHLMFESHPVHHYELEVLPYNYKSLNNQFQEVADNALFDLWENKEAEYLNEIV